MAKNDSMITNANGIAPVLILAAAYDQFVADPNNNGDDTGFFASGANKATITSADFTRVYPVSLGSDTNESLLTGNPNGMVTTRGQLGELLAAGQNVAAGATSNSFANLYSGDQQYILALTVLPN